MAKRTRLYILARNNMRRKLYSRAKNMSKMRRPLDMLGGEKHTMSNADMTLNWKDIRKCVYERVK